MVCLQVIGEDGIVAAAGAQGNFELNAMRPIIIDNVLHSATVLGDASDKLRAFSVEGTELDRQQIDRFVGASLMLVTALSPVIVVRRRVAIAHKAEDEGTSLRDAAGRLRGGPGPVRPVWWTRGRWSGTRRRTSRTRGHSCRTPLGDRRARPGTCPDVSGRGAVRRAP